MHASASDDMAMVAVGMIAPAGRADGRARSLLASLHRTRVRVGGLVMIGHISVPRVRK